ncbi:MAG: replication-relaxation family protein [candidate division Zixibacteria bacterium]|jgi:hypothetical protein|nr:replication-relaxation family protein [candidate division Zixibacteria bacterium]
MNEEKTMETTRSRKRRGSQALTLHDRDLQILHLIYQHRFLDMELMSAFVTEERETESQAPGADGKHRPRRYGFGEKALYKRLRQLAKAKYLEPHQALARPMGRGFGGARIAYGLGRASAEAVAAQEGVTVAQVGEIVEANRVKAPFIQHALAVARFRVILELACQASGGKVRILFWEQGNVLQDWIWGEDWEGEERKFSVYPDAFFGIEVEGKGRAHYFLELDRGTMPIVAKGDRSDIRKKVYGFMFYRRVWKGTPRYLYRTLPDGTVAGVAAADGATLGESSPLPMQPIKSFRVLFVAPGATAGTLSERGRIANILCAFPSFGKAIATSTLFWFASLDTFELKRPETLFQHVWVTPNPDHERKSIIE